MTSPICYSYYSVQLQFREQRTGISSGGYPARAKQRHAILGQGASVCRAVRPGTRNEGTGGSLVAQGAAYIVSATAKYSDVRNGAAPLSRRRLP
jgi:hypothetical protein